MAKLVLSDGGGFHRPGRPHVFSPGLRAAAHYLNAVEEVQAAEKVDRGVRQKLMDKVLGSHPFPWQFVDWQGVILTPESIELDPIPGLPMERQQQQFEQARPFLEALQAWANEYYMWSPFILELLYKVLKLRDEVNREAGQLASDIRTVYEKRKPPTDEDQKSPTDEDQESATDEDQKSPTDEDRKPPLTDEERRWLEVVQERLQFLKGEQQGWGWWVDFLSSDITIPQLDAWLAGHGLCPPSVPGTVLLNMPSSPSKAALWIYERLERYASKSQGVSSLSEVNRQLLVRWDRLHIDMGWEPSSPAPPFQLVMAGWRTEEESWPAAKARFESGFKQYLKIYRAAVEKRLRSGQLHARPKDSEHVKWGEPHRWEAVPTKYGDEHFRWLALRQIEGLRPEQIVRHRDVKAKISAVNDGIAHAAELMQLTIRSVRSGPPEALGD